jgi:hypothetical protein
LRRLPGVSSEFQASQAASLRKKTQLDAKALWGGLIGGKVIFDFHAYKLPLFCR